MDNELKLNLIGMVLRGLDAINWYTEANLWCAEVAQSYDLEVWQVAGIAAALSPQRRWYINKRQTIEFIEAKGDIWLHFGHQIRKAQQILAGEDPDKVLTGLKVTCFYHNLMLNDSKVTVDRHMLRALRIEGRLTPLRYEYALGALKEVADVFNLRVPQVQAAIWSTLAY